MKILIAVLTSLLIVLAVPALIKDCSGNSFLDIGKTSVNPATLILAYNKLMNTMNKPCVQPTLIKHTFQLHKWQDASGVWHYSDVTINNQSGDNGTVAIESTLYSNAEPEPPIVKTWLPFALIGFCLGLCGILYSLMVGVEMALQSFRQEETDSKTTAHYQRQAAGEAIEFFSTSPHAILGIDAEACFEEAKTAYEAQLRALRKASDLESDERVLKDINKKIALLQQAFESITRRKKDKFLATSL